RLSLEESRQRTWFFASFVKGVFDVFQYAVVSRLPYPIARFQRKDAEIERPPLDLSYRSVAAKNQ
ncbi:hypothetical protein JW824_10245, partial [bacterium]|nr:hypothetical protein [bacterium]